MTGDADRAFARAAADWSATKRVRAGRWNVRYREAGEGPPLVLVHGLGVSCDYWWRNGPALAAAGFRVLAPDLPGFGRTDGPAWGLTVPDQAEAVDCWAREMGIGPAAYAGHSLSCQAVVHLAAERPERVSALVLASPTGDRRSWRMTRELLSFAADVPRESWRLIPIVAQAYLRTNPLRYWRTWHSAGDDDPFLALPSVRAPALVVVGERDPVVPVDFARALADGLRDGRLVTIPSGAHAVIFGTADAFNREVVAFLRSALRPPR
ncbi:MAG TPA: alpha/beta hydrolase [Longimicrobiaceae bacterium]|nr:alpha/beta hydrolase [Longimicrobiaceae bacterium]